MKKYIMQLAGAYIKKLRLDTNHKLEYIVAVTKINKSKLCKIENGQQALDHETLFTLCMFYDISVSGFWRLIEMDVFTKYPPLI